MNLELYLAFVLATTVLIIIPGPNVALIVAHSVSFGARRGLVTVAGTQCAQAIQVTVTAIGMTSLMLLLSQWFEWLRWIGVAYLLYLGIRQWRSSFERAANPEVTAGSARPLFWQGFLVAMTNPKTLFFYAAFFPQFVDPHLPFAGQMVLLCLTYLAIATVLDGGYAIAAGRARAWFGNARRMRWQNRISGSLLIGAGVGLALARRS